MSTFIPGQRWISETEPELGLGTVVSVEGRIVTMLFMASGETRNYATGSAPLQRVAFKPGDQVKPAEGETFTVAEVVEREGLLSYLGDGREAHESELGDASPGSRPEDRLLRGDVDGVGTFALRVDCLRQRAKITSSPVRGFIGARIDLIPHQLYIASTAAGRPAPRILLADEVGLGKTIEACLILQRLLLTGRVGRVLIMVPEALVHQWFVELLRRFNLRVSLFDEERCEGAEPGSPSENPFLSEQLIVASESFFDAQPRRRMQAVEAGWDLVIIDEAHHLAWSPEASSPLYQFVEALAGSVPGVLLLTATPEELGPESHFARMRLLDPGRYPDLATFRAEHEGYEETAKEAEVMMANGEDIGELLDRYGPGRVMFRNTRRRMKGFPKRIMRGYALEAGASREAWLADLLRELKGEKVLLICTAKEQVLQLNHDLAEHIQVKTALFHEDLEIIQRDRNAAWFSEDEGAQVLLCSQIGGEGRNFQFAHHLVLYDLPEHPEMIEQRIGRLDRIGQRETVHIHVPYARGTGEERLVRWLHEGLNAFETSLSGGDEIFQAFRDRMEGAFDALLAETRAFKQDLQARLEAGTNRLLEMHSFDEDSAANTIAAVQALDGDPELEPFLLRLFDHFGIHAEEIERHVWHLVPGHTFRDGLPGFSKEGMTVTLDRATALDREDYVFMTWDHPLVTGAMDQLLGSAEGSGAAALWSGGGGRGLVVEGVYVLEASGPPALELPRFLPATLIRVAIDLNEDLADTPPPLDLPDGRKAGLLDGGEALELRVRELLEACGAEAEQRAADCRVQAAAGMHEHLDAELARLKHLSGINDHVHPEELTDLAKRIIALDRAIEGAGLRLDAVRLIARS